MISGVFSWLGVVLLILIFVCTIGAMAIIVCAIKLIRTIFKKLF